MSFKIVSELNFSNFLILNGLYRRIPSKVSQWVSTADLSVIQSNKARYGSYFLANLISITAHSFD